MRFRPRTLVVAAVVGATALAASMATAAAQSTGSSDPVRIGLEAPLTGDQKAIGQGMLKGAQLAADQLNADGGIAGRKVVIVPIDDAADPETGVKAANAAIAAGLEGVVGPYNSGVGIKTLPLYIQAGLVPLRLTSADSTNGLGLTLQPMTYQIAPIAAEALTDWLGAKSVAIIYDDSTLYTQSVSAALKSELESANVKIASFTPIQPGAKSYAATLETVAATSPDVIYLATYYPEGGLIAKEMYEAEMTPKCLADYGSYSTGFHQVSGVKAAQACPIVGVPAPHEFSGAKPYMKAYAKQFGTKSGPGVWAPYTYDSVNLLAAGVERAGGWVAAPLQSAMTELTGFTGWTGTVTIDPTTLNREPATVVVLRTDRKGQLHLDEGWAKAVGAQI